MMANEGLFKALAKTIGTPYYCYDATAIREQFRRLRATLPEDLTFFYSLKANPNKAIVSILHAEGAGCEVCSLTELETALAAGVPPQHILFVGPAKSAEELRRCVELGICAVIVESLPELTLLEGIAASMGVVPPVGLRINPRFKPPAAKLVMSGKPTQFGIDENQLVEALRILESSTHMRLTGIHGYMGTRILDASTIQENTRRILQWAARIAENSGQPLDFVDVGGGFGVKYFNGETELDLQTLGTELSGLVKDFQRRCPTTRIIIELGRYLVAHAGIFVTAVRYVKRCGDTLFAICDGGSNCHASAAGLSSLFRRNFPIARLTGSRSGSAVYTLTGPLCTPTDVIAENILLGELESGDLVGVYQSGAYGASASPVHFLGFGQPAEVLVDGSTVLLIRAPTSVKDVLASQVALPIDVPL
jgi:diaminopimelate decarboxylase